MKNPFENDIFAPDKYAVGARLIYIGANTGAIKHRAKGKIAKVEGKFFFVQFSETISAQCTKEDLEMYFCLEPMQVGEVLADDYDID